MVGSGFAGFQELSRRLLSRSRHLLCERPPERAIRTVCMRPLHPIDRNEQITAVEANRASGSPPIEAERRRSGLGQPIDKHRQGRPSSAAVKRSALRPLNPTFAGKSGCGDVPDALAELDATVGEILDAVDLLRIREVSLSPEGCRGCAGQGAQLWQIRIDSVHQNLCRRAIVQTAENKNEQVARRECRAA